MTTKIIVGRRKQIAQLRAHCQTALEDGQGHVVFLTGEAGIGKTTLGQRVCDLMCNHVPGLRYAYAQCAQVTGDISPYAPFVALHERLFEQTQPQDKSWLVEYAREVGPDFFDIVPVVGPALKAAFATVAFAWEKVRDRRTARAEATSLPDQTAVFQRFTTSLRLLAARHPLLLFVDDWQWADTSSTNLLFHLARQLDGAPLLVLAAYRRHDAQVKKHPILDIHREMKRYHLCHTIDLTFLTAQDVADYYRRRFKAHAGDALVEQLMRLTEGNALFLVEYLNLLEEQGALTAGGDLTVALGQLPVPDSLRALIEKRLSYLAAPERQTLDCASVEANGNGRGEEFTALFLRRALDAGPQPLVRRLDGLERVHRLIASLGYHPFYPGQDDTSVYCFVHTLVHRTLYEDLPPEIRVALNRHLLDLKREVYEAADEAAQSQLLPQMVAHAGEARDYLAQARYALDAAREAAWGYAHAEVLKQCTVGLGALDALRSPTPESQAVRMDLLLRRGRTEEFTGEWDRALEACDQARVLAEEQEDEGRLGEACFGIGVVHYRQGEYDQALEWHHQSRTIAEKLGDQADLARAYNDIGLIYDARGEYDQALEWYHQSVAIKEKLGDQAGPAATYNNIGLIYYGRGEYDQALKWVHQAVAIVDKLGDRAGLATSYNNIGGIYSARGEYDQALEWYHKSLALLEKLGDQANLAGSYNNIGAVHRARGEVDQALEWYHQAVAIKEKLGDQAGLATSYNNIGFIHKARGEYDQALEWYLQAVAIREKLGDQAGLATSYNNIGEAHRARGEYDQALEWHHQSVSIKEKLGDQAGLAASYNIIGAVHRARGEYDQALEWYHRAVVIWDKLGNQAGLATSYNNIGGIYDDRGKVDQALEWYHKAVAIQEKLGDRQGLAATLHNMGHVALAQEEPGRALGLFQRSRDICAALGLSKDVARAEEMIEQARASLSSMEEDKGTAMRQE